MRLPSWRKTAPVSAASRSPRPRTRSDPCSATKARSASRCSAAQRAASPAASVRSTGGLPGCRSTLSSEVGGEYVISAPPFAASSGRRAGRRAAADWDGRRTHSGALRPVFLFHLPLARPPETVPPMEGRRDHVLGQRRAEPFPQRIGIQWPLAGIEGHQALAAVGPLRDDDRVLTDAWHA